MRDMLLRAQGINLIAKGGDRFVPWIKSVVILITVSLAKLDR
jgi:hypothetical protein